MSRRESRVSMNVRQNDALFEFENFKKKFLLANKHITKLNSTLSVRIEELNAQISSLYVENLRLRASEIALAAQLKREREKSRKIMAEADAAASSLTKHLGYLRQSFNIRSTPPAPTTPTSPRARRPPANINTSPTSLQTNHISRPPDVPGIYEDEEPFASSSDQEPDKPPSPVRRKSKSKPRLSASRLPLPSRMSSPPPLPTHGPHPSYADQELSTSTKPRKPTRRRSALLSANNESLSIPRAASPAFGSPIRREAGLAVEEDEIAAVNNQLQLDVDTDTDTSAAPVEERRKGKNKELEDVVSEVLGSEAAPPAERKKAREEEDGSMNGSKSRFKNTTHSRMALSPIDNTVHDQADGEAALPTARPFLATSPTPTSRSSSSPVPSADGEGGVLGGRERRARKSVNYAEPKLNTKMRKPGPPAERIPKKRSSAAAVLTSYRPPDDIGNDADNDTEARSSLELPLRVNGNYIDPETFPLPPSRPTSAASLFSPAPVSRVTTSSSSSPSTAATSVKRKKSRPQLLPRDDESDGTQADAEYGGGRGETSGWINVDGRRKIGAVKKNVVAVDDGRAMQELNGRRHSMVV